MVETALLATGLILSYLASLLLKPKVAQNPAVRNPTNPTYAERGSYIPFVLGTQRVGAMVGWIGKPKVKSTTSGGILGFGATTTKSVSQQGWHILCIGPATKLLKIFENGKIIFPYKTEVPITPTSHPSGTQITLKSKRGKFRIYWGEATQPADAILGAPTTGVGTVSRWPHICYVVWNTKALSVANQWPQIDYEIEVQPWGDASGTPFLSSTASWIPGVTDPLQGAPFKKNTGCNPAHALVQVMCGSYPQGAGIPATDLNLCLFEEMGTLLSDAGSGENQPANLYVPDGQNALNPATAICSDTSTIMSQTGNKISVIPVRIVDDTTIPTIDDVLLPPLAQKEFLFGPQPVSQVTYLYKDREVAYRDNDITVSNDGVTNGVVNSQQVRLDTIIDRDIAVAVTDRRQQEDLTATRSYTVTACKGARLLQPGQAFIATDLGRLRISGVTRKIDSALVEIECASDTYSAPPTGTVPDPGIPSDPGTPADQIANDQFDWIEAPPPLANGLSLIVVRQRQDDNVDSASIEASLDGTNYINIGTIPGVFLQGTLNAAMTVDSPPAISLTGPIIFVSVPDDDDIFTDLTLQDLRWRSGEQVMICQNEIFYFSNLVPLGSGNYRVDGLIRGRSGSLVKTHTSGTHVWLAPMASLVALTGSVLIPGQTVYVKDLAIVDTDIADETTVTAVSKSFLGVSKSPYPPVDFRAEDLGQMLNTWLAGAAVTLQWANRCRNVGSVAGTQPAGAVMSTPPMDGSLILNIKDTGGVLKLSLTITTGRITTITNADLVTAFGGVEPSAFDISYFQFDGAFASETNVVRINRR